MIIAEISGKRRAFKVPPLFCMFVATTNNLTYVSGTMKRLISTLNKCYYKKLTIDSCLHAFDATSNTYDEIRAQHEQKASLYRKFLAFPVDPFGD